MLDALRVARCRVIPSFLALCQFLLVLGGLVSGCDSTIKNETQFTVRSVKPFEHRAIDEAKKWKADAYLSSVSVDALALDSRTPPAAPDLLYYLFRSRNDLQHTYSVAFLLNGRIELWEGLIFDPNSDYIAIEPTDWTVDSTDAWRIAQENGGSEFFPSIQTGALHAFLELERRNPPRSGPVLWYVGYANQAMQHSLRILIDARTGVVVSKEIE